jgi:hypothetical protein
MRTDQKPPNSGFGAETTAEEIAPRESTFAGGCV